MMKDSAALSSSTGRAVALAGRGILILGASGSGKSALALALVAGGAALVADDRVATRPARAGARRPAAAGDRGPRRGARHRHPPLPPEPEAVLTLAVDLDRAPVGTNATGCDNRGTSGSRIELIFGRGIPNLDRALTIIVQNGRAFPD